MGSKRNSASASALHRQKGQKEKEECKQYTPIFGIFVKIRMI